MNQDEAIVIEEGDFGEATEKPPTSPEEVAIISREKTEANIEISQKLLKQAIESEIIDSNLVEIYVLPKETLSIGKLQTQINELTNQINSHELGETETKAEDLLSQRAELVTQLMYTISALLTVKMSEIAVQIKDSIVQARSTGVTTQLENKVQKVQSFYSVLEVYSTSTQEVMTLFRKDFSHVITDDFLGELNVKLYQAINLNTQDLPVQEKISGGGTLSDRLTTLKKRLKPLFDFSVSDLDSLQLADEETKDIEDDNENDEENLEPDDPNSDLGKTEQSV